MIKKVDWYAKFISIFGMGIGGLGLNNDYYGLYTKDELKLLDSLVRSFERKTTVEIGVAVIKSSMVKDEDFEDFTLVLINTWGVGKKKINNGILIVIAPEYRILRVQN